MESVGGSVARARAAMVSMMRLIYRGQDQSSRVWRTSNLPREVEQP
jgi:hypothetical protein